MSAGSMPVCCGTRTNIAEPIATSMWVRTPAALALLLALEAEDEAQHRGQQQPHGDAHELREVETSENSATTTSVISFHQDEAAMGWGGSGTGRECGATGRRPAVGQKSFRAQRAAAALQGAGGTGAGADATPTVGGTPGRLPCQRRTERWKNRLLGICSVVPSDSVRSPPAWCRLG